MLNFLFKSYYEMLSIIAWVIVVGSAILGAISLGALNHSAAALLLAILGFVAGGACGFLTCLLCITPMALFVKFLISGSEYFSLNKKES